MNVEFEYFSDSVEATNLSNSVYCVVTQSGVTLCYVMKPYDIHNN